MTPIFSPIAQKYLRPRNKKGFSLIEVLFSISFLLLVGFALISLNVATLRLVTDSEVKTAAYALNDETISFLKVKYRKLTAEQFRTLVNGPGCSGTCYLKCSTTDLTQGCSLHATAQPAQLGRSKLQFVRSLQVAESPRNSGRYLVRSSLRWGSGANRQIQTSHYLQ